MSIPRQIRTLAKLVAAAFLVVVLILGAGVVGLRRRGRRIQAVYESVAVGDSWRGLDGFAERPVASDPASQVPPEHRYQRRVMLPMPVCWEIVVDEDGRVAGKYRYD